MDPASEIASVTGRAELHLCAADDAARLGAQVHRDVVSPFEQLRATAAVAGFNLAILSGFRSFERQLSIWNRKAAGQLAVLDTDARPVDIATLSARDLAFAILRWSALPGASRHHWGTDIDIYDMAATPAGYEVQLVPAEVSPGGMYGLLHEWLDARIAAGEACGFFRPYDVDRGGVAPERWHLSYAPVATAYLGRLTIDVLRETIQPAEMLLKDEVLRHIEEIYERFVTNVNSAIA